MISDRSAKYLWDARAAADRIARFVAGHDLDAFQADELVRAAVERQFEIIGEAFAGLRKHDPDLASSIPDLARIIAFRNLLIYGYAVVDPRRVWGIVEGDLPRLRATLEALLNGIP